MRDEIAAAMLLVVAFCSKLTPVTFRKVVEAVLPLGPVLSPAQLSPELREAWEREDKAGASSTHGRAPLPSWDQVMEHHAYDKAMSSVRCPQFHRSVRRHAHGVLQQKMQQAFLQVVPRLSS